VGVDETYEALRLEIERELQAQLALADVNLSPDHLRGIAEQVASEVLWYCDVVRKASPGPP
jgi:hypothetical protein